MTAPVTAAPRIPNALSTIKALIGRRVRYETVSGTIRTGRLTGLRVHPLKIGGSVYEIPSELICDNDETDATAILDVIRIEVIPAG
ncbi:hypothetical protein [Zavarzinia sp.]|uniref:hypothetical protein n=1 Tax=Zavarzinia sp. TaxID=2027920 RepID=UPI0035630045